MNKKHYWQDLTAGEFSGLDRDSTVAVLPVAAIEQHGPHLPLSVDADIVDEIIRRSLPMIQELEILFLPTQRIGKSNEHAGFAGTLSFSAITLYQTWLETGESVARAGIKKFLLFNGHGGNVATMDSVARDLRAEHDVLTAHCSWFSITRLDDIVNSSELLHGIHGGEIETSMMLAARPGTVNMDAAEDFQSAGRGWQRNFNRIGVGPGRARVGWLQQDLNVQGACGNAAAATSEKGERILARATDSFVELLREFSAFDQVG